MMIQRRVIISGEVQGVGFRASTLREAQAFPKVKGYVKNLPDGRVEAVFAGPEKEVLTLTAWCKKGPRLARVSQLEVKEEAYQTDWDEFQIQ
jgi:acylphosphatase